MAWYLMPPSHYMNQCFELLSDMSSGIHFKLLYQWLKLIWILLLQNYCQISTHGWRQSSRTSVRPSVLVEDMSSMSHINCFIASEHRLDVLPWLQIITVPVRNDREDCMIIRSLDSVALGTTGKWDWHSTLYGEKKVGHIILWVSFNTMRSK